MVKQSGIIEGIHSTTPVWTLLNTRRCLAIQASALSPMSLRTGKQVAALSGVLGFGANSCNNCPGL